jgi:hypothetical protein
VKRIALILVVASTILARPAHAAIFDFTWESQAWVITFESSTQFTVTGPLPLSGHGTVTLADLASGGRSVQFDGGSGTLLATGDGTFNGSLTFATASPDTPRTGLGVLAPTSNGFTLIVNRAASGPDPGAAFSGIATPLSPTTTPAATTPEPGVWVMLSVGLAAVARLKLWRRG